MDYIENQEKAKNGKYTVPFLSFKMVFICSIKSLKDGFYMSPYFSKIMASLSFPFFYHFMDYLKNGFISTFLKVFLF